MATDCLEDLRLINPDTATDLLDVSRKTVDRLIAAGEIPAFKLGGSTRIRVRSLEEYLQRNKWRD